MERGRVENPVLLAKANTVIDGALATAGGNPRSRESADAWVKAKRDVEKHPALLNLASAYCDARGFQRPRVSECPVATSAVG